MEPGTFAHVPKPGIYVFKKIREERENADRSDMTKEWINDIPDNCRKRSALTEISNVRSRRRKLNDSDAMARIVKRVEASNNRDEDYSQDLEAAEGQHTGPQAPIRRRTTRAAQRQKQHLEIQKGSENVNLRPALDTGGDCLVNDRFMGPTRLQSFGEESSSTPSQQRQRVLSPFKNPSESTRSSSPNKKSTRIDTQRLGFYEPRISFMSYTVAKNEGLLTEPVRTLWRDFILPCVSGPPSIPYKLKAGILSLIPWLH